jgi:hypothetical protein
MYMDARFMAIQKHLRAAILSRNYCFLLECSANPRCVTPWKAPIVPNDKSHYSEFRKKNKSYNSEL